MPYIAPTPFCTIADVQSVGLPAVSIGTLSAAAQQQCVDIANGEAGARLAGRYPGINVNGGAGWTWSAEVVGWAVAIAQKLMLDRRGRAASSASADKEINDRAAAGFASLDAVQRQALHPAIAPTETPGETSQGPSLISTSTGWTDSARRAPNRGI